MSKQKEKKLPIYLTKINDSIASEAENMTLSSYTKLIEKGTKIEVIGKSGKLQLKFLRLKNNKICIGEISKSMDNMAVLVKLSDISHVLVGTATTALSKTKKFDAEKIQNYFTLCSQDSKTVYEFCAQSRQEFVSWVDYIRYHTGWKMEEQESVQEIEDTKEILLQLVLINRNKKKPPIPPLPVNYDFVD
ncbi:engulfment and cell motility protein [Anaeramoeba flamelloides]|uniref:Engulfment and cell motility protein n=1 Tax=Anaeramoeba flamelloides TaxID=1746091 RepID=A0ABQ8XD73_9EUKA|nr:engulfment and cell motility protein [Anaeramoeba flamelloides]